MGASGRVARDPSELRMRRRAPSRLSATRCRAPSRFTVPTRQRPVCSPASTRRRPAHRAAPDLAVANAFDDDVRVLLHQVAKSLTGSPPGVSLAAGGAQALALDAGAEHAGGFYLMLGTLSGTSPGWTAGAITVPLNADPYLDLTLLDPAASPLAGSFGFLGPTGQAGGLSFGLPPGTNPALVGLTAHHACAVLETIAFTPVFASNAVGVALLP